MTLQELDDGVTKITLTGRIDIAGALELDRPLSVVCGSRRAVVMDLSGVTFIASMGLRSLVLCARTVQSKAGRMTMFGARPEVAEVITTMGIDELVLLYATETDAIAALR